MNFWCIRGIVFFYRGSIFTIFVEVNFNCTMRTHRCGWKDTGSSFIVIPSYNTGMFTLKLLLAISCVNLFPSALRLF